MSETYHVPVLFNEVLQSLNIKDGFTFVDGTLGGGGHTEGILNSAKNVKVIAFDRDKEAITFSKKRLEKYGDNVLYIHSNYKEITNYLKRTGQKVDGILLDLGVSSHQIDDEKRGFSFRMDSKLDMRMNQEDDLTAYDIVNNYKEEDLANIIYNYGEDRLSRKIAKAIVYNRPIETTFKLKEVVEACVKKFNSKEISSSVQRVFQAIRIEVNNELNGLKELFLSFPEVVNSGGRVAIITFHSLEDRIVKQAFQELATNCICPPKIPVCVCNHKAKAKIVTKKPIVATIEEQKSNSRSTSAKLRVIEIL